MLYMSARSASIRSKSHECRVVKLEGKDRTKKSETELLTRVELKNREKRRTPIVQRTKLMHPPKQFPAAFCSDTGRTVPTPSEPPPQHLPWRFVNRNHRTNIGRHMLLR
ncbi:hypothetical protein BDV09DRAFT_165483 [Aspergillus tetrazonus]